MKCFFSSSVYFVITFILELVQVIKQNIRETGKEWAL